MFELARRCSQGIDVLFASNDQLHVFSVLTQVEAQGVLANDCLPFWFDSGSPSACISVYVVVLVGSNLKVSSLDRYEVLLLQKDERTRYHYVWKLKCA